MAYSMCQCVIQAAMTATVLSYIAKITLFYKFVLRLLVSQKASERLLQES
jgi:hypothetical protein